MSSAPKRHTLQLPRHKQHESRPSASARGYGRMHQRWRLLILSCDPICKMCDREPSTEADHIDGDNTNLAESNGQGLCKSCHGSKTREQTGWMNWCINVKNVDQDNIELVIAVVMAEDLSIIVIIAGTDIGPAKRKRLLSLVTDYWQHP